MIWPGQSGIDARVKSVSPQSVACPVTHTHTLEHDIIVTRLNVLQIVILAHLCEDQFVSDRLTGLKAEWLELILAAGFIQGTNWQGLTQCFDLDIFRQVV